MPQRKRKNFWNAQYKKPTHLALSEEPAEDLVKFTRFVERAHGKKFFNVTTQALDLGCGNGRNLIYLAEMYGMRGVGYDASSEAIAQAQKSVCTTYGTNEKSPVKFAVRDLREPVPLPDSSVTLVLDMMSSHVLKKAEREALRAEILRVLKPGGWFFFKSFLLEGDRHAERLLREHPGDEEGMYIHPEIGNAEHVWTEDAIQEFFDPYFTIHKIDKSHKHQRKDGKAWKRRTISVYLQKS